MFILYTNYMRVRLLLLNFIIIFIFTFVFPNFINAAWTNQGDLYWMQRGHQAVSLGNGKVLITGGEYTTLGTDHTQIYTDNPSGTGTWQGKATMNLNRKFFTLDIIKVNNVTKVLATGGASDNCANCKKNTGEIYDIANNTWTYTSNMNQARHQHASSILSDGKILISGGASDSFSKNKLSSTEIYDPTFDTWTLMTPLNTQRLGHKQVTFNDSFGNEKVMVIGGYGMNDLKLTSTEIYDPSNNSWSFGPPISFARSGFEAISLHDGRILILGGRGVPEGQISEIYDIKTNTWTTITQPYFAFDNQAVVLDKNHNYKVLVAGGSEKNLGISNTMLFDPITNQWIEGDKMNIARTNFSLTLLDNGRVLAAGGYNKIDGWLKSSEVYSVGEVLGETAPPVGFLDLPWNYQSKGMDFSEAALSINSYFDHSYPFLAFLSEPLNFQNQVTTFKNGNRTDAWYSSHNGYDYGLSGGAKVSLGDDVLAAAAGTAEVVTSCAACGNMVVIDHNNGYQTKYMHLLDTGLISSPGIKTPVSARQKIGEVGSTGNSEGAHIHFGVYQDKNDDKNFDDNILDGLTDPYGWQSEIDDPWETYTFNYLETQKTGNKSTYLWKNSLGEKIETLDTNAATFTSGKFNLSFPPTSVDKNVKLKLSPEPIYFSKLLSSIGTTFSAKAEDFLGNEITQFLKSFILTVNFSSEDLSKIIPESLSVYSSQDGNNWTKETTTLDLINKVASINISHFTYFALMGQRKDITAPTTNAGLLGNKGNDNWFRSDVELSLNAQDNEGGLGVQYTAYRNHEGNWQKYESPLTFTDEGNYKIEFYSEDNDGNLEDIRTVEFQIDKTEPSITAHITIDGSDYDSSWTNKNTLTTFSCTDSLSGVNLLTNPILTSTEGENQKASGECQDKAGNVGFIEVSGINIDKTPPEAQIKFNISTLDFEIKAVDISATTILWSNALKNKATITLSDSAGNTLKILGLYKDTKEKDKILFESLQYMENPIINFGQTKLTVKYENKKKINNLKKLVQKLEIKKQLKLGIDYDGERNISKIIIKEKGSEKIKNIVSGLRILTITTQKGNLNYSF